MAGFTLSKPSFAVCSSNCVRNWRKPIPGYLNKYYGLLLMIYLPLSAIHCHFVSLYEINFLQLTVNIGSAIATGFDRLTD